VAQETLNVRRTVLVGDRLYYRVRVRSFQPHPVKTSVELVLGADFSDVFEVRGIERRTSGQLLAPVAGRAEVRFAYVAQDGERRETVVQLSPPAARFDVGGAHVRVAWDVELFPGEPVTLLVIVDPRVGEAGARAAGLQPEAARLEQAHRNWADACSRITTDNELFDRFIDASIRDLHALMMPLRDGALPAAGIPWYGRRSAATRC